ncbi:hypothetical protein EW146_g1996 [Bondarzewia mesenterica]|uniref:Uncharacterized protein n=1 Tax=Bondarzewia mesenterica TaxID=1095465 RepID=A0A4S4M412_9AGAM|nr:hypothetical protein EW146_g1996 [Bondarzewia mesenterica]
MIPRRPRLRLDSVTAHDFAPHPPSNFVPLAGKELEYPYTSVFRSRHLEVTIYSPLVKISRWQERGVSQTLPIFGDRDHPRGMITVDPQLSSVSGRITVSIEGSFSYVSSTGTSEGTSSSQLPGKYRHVFFSACTIFASGNIRAGGSILGAFARRTDQRPGAMRKNSVKRKLSLTNLDIPGQQIFPFSFDLPQPSRMGEEMPSTFVLPEALEDGARGITPAEKAEVSYKILVVWDPIIGTEATEGRQILEVPVLIQHDNEFLSLDGLQLNPESWLEIPLRSDRPIPCHCAVTLPSPSEFPRSASIPYFVIFSITPKSVSLAREVASDATITVSLLRQVTIDPSQSRTNSVYPSPPSTPPSPASDESESPSLYSLRRNKLFNRVVRSPSTSCSTDAPQPLPRNKPLPELPAVISESRILQTNVSIGFPKRPRHHTNPRGHPSLESHSSLPDGLYKGRLRLSKSLPPSIDWPGLGIKVRPVSELLVDLNPSAF